MNFGFRKMPLALKNSWKEYKKKEEFIGAFTSEYEKNFQVEKKCQRLHRMIHTQR